MKEILDILMKAPINQLAAIDPKLAGLVIKAADLDIKRECSPDELKPVVVTCNHDMFQMIQKEQWTNQQIVDAGYGYWENENE